MATQSVFVCELEPGDVNVFDEVVESVHDINGKVRVAFTNGPSVYFKSRDSTMRIYS